MNSSSSTEVKYSVLKDYDVVIPLLLKEFKEGVEILLQKGVSPHLLWKVFRNMRDKVGAKIYKLGVSMKGFDMTAVLSKYYATQLPPHLFGSFRGAIAKTVVDAVNASGYHYQNAGPFMNGMPDFEDGFNLIEIKKVLGGCMKDSFSVEGVGIMFKTVDGFEDMDVVKNPEILILNINPDQDSQVKDMSAEVNLVDILKNHVKRGRGPNVVLTRQAIDGDSKKELAKRCIYFADLVSEDDLNRLKITTYAEKISYKDNYSQIIHIGTCKSFQQKIVGNEVFGIFKGCPRGHVATIVLCGDDQLIEEAEEYVLDLIPQIRSVMNEYKLVEGGRRLYDNIIEYLRKEENDAEDDSKPIINAFAKAIQAVSEKTYGNVGCNPSQKHAIAPGVDDIVWEPPSVKFYAILCAAQVTCYNIKHLKQSKRSGSKHWD